jgi:RNA polymerase sigma-70 factor (ECF subfamily)
MYQRSRHSGEGDGLAERIVQPEVIAAPRNREREFSSILGPELDRAYRVAGRILGNASDAEDATQEALAMAWASWHTLKAPEAAQGWFWRILVNCCRSRLRRRRAFVRDITDELGLTSQDPFETSNARDAVARALTVLNGDQRVTVVLRFWGELTVPEIAERMRVRQGTVKSRLHYGLIALRRELDGNGEIRQ